MTGEPTRPEPPVTATSRAFWDATRDQQFVLQWCRPCGAPIFYPRDNCPRCLGTDLEWRPASGRGTIHAVSVQHKPQHPLLAGRAPYAVGLVELDEGVRMLTNIVGTGDPYEAKVGQAVELVWERLSDGRNLPVFTPAQEA